MPMTNDYEDHLVEGRTRHALVEFAMDRPRLVLWIAGLLAVTAALASLGVQTDTDPENMLPADHEVRVRNADMRETFAAHEMLVVGVVDEDGVATPELLTAVDDLRAEIAGFDGVRSAEIVSFASSGAGSADLTTQAGVDAVVAAVGGDPALAGNVLSEDGTTAALFVPLQEKSDANPVTADIEQSIDDAPALQGTETYVAGLPLAEEAFGEQMFVQMAIFAPLAGLLIFLLMLWFFRKISLVLAAMAVAMLSVVWTMGLLIGSGNSLHIMSSMIPIFLMPIAILDSIHVLSEFFDRYPHHLDRRATLRVVYAELYRPLAFTSVTTAVAFAALALAPIPPIRSFGLFIAVGVVAAWLLTIVFIPAYVMTMSETRLAKAAEDRPESQGQVLNGFVRSLGRLTTRHRGLVLGAFAVAAVFAVPGIARIEVNDNPVKWFKPGSDVRVATEELNERLPGTFNANVLLTAESPEALLQPETVEALDGLAEVWASVGVIGSSVSYADLVDGATAEEIDSQLTEAGENPLLATLITEDRADANIRLQLNDGDNQAMRAVVDATDEHLEANPLPAGITTEWAGETYLNLVWQDEMVSAMLSAFLSTLVVVALLMVALFRSVKWAMLSILPVLWTVLVVYGALGLIGKDYDMPIAVLSTLVLGIGVDFAIHFVQRFREYYEEFGDRRATLRAFFEEPARALTRNALVIAIGFTPLLLSSLTPYLVVGVFLSVIILLSWLATLLMLPAIVAGPDNGDDVGADASPDGTADLDQPATDGAPALDGA